ncbi:hypothetical protein BgiMline_017681, partial [Biomphalaria glabrata]
RLILDCNRTIMRKSKFIAAIVVTVFLKVSFVQCVTFEAALQSTAYKCQVTFSDCMQQSSSLKDKYNAKQYCDIFNASINGVHMYHCLVSNGLCTEDEFDDFTIAACGFIISDFVVSDYKEHFYKIIDSTSTKCQNQILSCINISTVATLVKQAEEFCYLLNLNVNGTTSQMCLSNQCSPAEFAILRVAACKEEYHSKKTEFDFGDLMMFTTPQCQGYMELCTVQSFDALSFIRNKRYCNVLELEENGKSPRDCLVRENENSCSVFEYNMMLLGACEDEKTLQNISPKCLNSIKTCVLMSPNAYYLFITEEYCDLFKEKFNGVTANQCLVEIGFCSQPEYDYLLQNLCDERETEAQFADSLLSYVIDTVDEKCQLNMLGCIIQSIIATLLKADSQYCSLMTFNTFGQTADKCLKSCTELEKSFIYVASCNTSLSTLEPSPFTKAVMSTSQTCKETIERCSFGSDLAFSSIQSGQYCQIMNIYQAGAETYACLVGSGGCTDSEFQAMTDAACDGD